MAELMILSGFMSILAIGCIIADYAFPHIPFIVRFLDSLPEYEDEDEEEEVDIQLKGGASCVADPALFSMLKDLRKKIKK
mgnify:CR=1 FL=1